METVLDLCHSDEGHFSVRAIVSSSDPSGYAHVEWVYVFNEDWKRTGVRIVMTDSEPRLEIDTAKALSLGAEGAARVLEASRFVRYVRAFEHLRNTKGITCARMSL